MDKLKTLVLMQLKDKIDFSNLSTKKQKIFKIVLSILKFSLITALIYVGFMVLDVLRLLSVLPGIPQNFISCVITIMIILSIITSTLGIMKSLYFNKDNPLLLTLPARKTAVFSSKLIVYYIYELIRNLTFLAPLLVAFAIKNALPIYFYLYLPVGLIITTALVVSVSALLSIPAMLLTIFIKKFRWLEISLLICFVAAIVWTILSIIQAIPSNFDLIGQWGTIFWEIQNFLTMFNNMFLPFTFITKALVGVRYGVVTTMFSLSQILSILGILGGIILCLGLSFLCSSPIYYKMASSPFEYKKVKVTKIISNKKHKSFISVVNKEIKTTIRTPEKFWVLILTMLAMPILIYLLNKIFASMDTRMAGAYMATAFNVLIVMLIALSSNAAFAHIYSEEGASSYLNRTNPQKHIKLLSAKLVVNMVCIAVSVFASICFMSAFLKYNFIQMSTLYLIIMCVYIAHALWSAEMDLMNPQTAQYQSTGTHVNNPNDIKSTIQAFILSALFSFVTYFFVAENASVAFVKVLVFAVIFLVIRVWLYINKIKVYYSEVQ